MKKQIIIAVLSAIALTASAQLKVKSDGKVYIQDNLGTGKAMLNIGTPTGINALYPLTKKTGIHAFVEDSLQSGDCMGVYSHSIFILEGWYRQRWLSDY